MRRGEPRVKRTPTALRSSSYEGCVASSTLRPCGLGCHMLGPRRTACLGTNLIRNPASNGITSRPAPRPRRTGEDDSPKPSDCLLYIVGYSSWGMDLVIHFLDDFSQGLVVSGTVVCIRLLCPPEFLLQYFVLLRPIGQTR